MKRLILPGILLSLALVAWVLYRLDWSLFLETLKQVRPGYILLGALTMLVSMSLRTLRWTWLSDQPLDRWIQFWRAFNIGYLGNIIYPARAGEVLRIAAISHLLKIPLARATTSSVLDRFLDLLVVGLALLAVMHIHGQDIVGPTLPWVLAGLLALGISGILLLLVLDRPLRRWLERHDPGSGWKHRLFETLEHGLAILGQFRRSHAGARVILASLCSVASDSLLSWLLLRAVGWTLPMDAGLTLFVFVALGASLPSAPGAIGIYQIACIFALSFYGIEESAAVAYSLLLQLTTFGVVFLTAGWVVLHYGLRLRGQSDVG